jgi:hypothetical protein
MIRSSVVRKDDPVEDRESLFLAFAGATALLLSKNIEKKYTPKRLMAEWNKVCKPYNDIIISEFKAFKSYDRRTD